MENKTPETLSNIWSKLSEDAQNLAISMNPGGEFSQRRDFLEEASQDPDMGFNLEIGIKELSELGLLQQITLLQERREQLANMPKPRAIMLIPHNQIPKDKINERLEELTEDERKYFRLSRQIEDYEKNHEKEPSKYEGWEKPRFRLVSDFQSFIDTIPDE